jgi:hypothetical protein
MDDGASDQLPRMPKLPNIAEIERSVELIFQFGVFGNLGDFAIPVTDNLI